MVLALLTFVPSLYLYTSYRGPFSRLTNALLLVWLVLLTIILARGFDDARALIWASLFFPLYYFVMSWAITLRRWFAVED